MKKYKLTTNLTLKIIAFVFAAFLWLIVANVDNPITRGTFSNITVQFANEDIITQGGEVYQVIGDQTVSVVVYAKRSVIQQIDSDDIVATADIKEMDAHTGLVPIKITIPKYSGEYQSADSVPKNLQIKTEKTGKAVFTITVSATGTPRDGYMLGEMKVSPEKITITGAQSKIEEIDKVVAKIQVDGISKDEEKDATLELYDKNGNELSQSQLTNNLGDEGITVDVEVLETKSVPLSFNVSGTPADGYKFTECTSEPASIQICGKKEILDTIEEIDIPGTEIDISGATDKVEKTVNVIPYLPEGVELVEGAVGEVTAIAMIEQEGTRTIDFMVASIKLNNLADGLQVKYAPDAEVTMTFQGEQDILDAMDITNAVSVNLQNYTQPGDYEVPVEVNVPEGVTLKENVTIQLTLQEKDQGDDQDEEQNSEQGE